MDSICHLVSLTLLHCVLNVIEYYDLAFATHMYQYHLL